MKKIYLILVLLTISLSIRAQFGVGISSYFGISKYKLGDSLKTNYFLCGGGGLYVNYMLQDHMAVEAGVGLDQFTTSYRTPGGFTNFYLVQSVGFTARYYYIIGEYVPVFLGFRPGIMFKNDLEYIDLRFQQMKTFALKAEMGIGYQGGYQTTGLMLGTDLRNLAPEGYPHRVSAF